ncbi:calcium/sodium antiporter [Natronogracilivirga saccharolytica]|uniref:Calcium/sodium antiporter n=1 Tax=Natronogracilivirga saccharolytica TaxID=2812953 RepID=A0A8J7UVI1_9BACT|nr:calcium/sodium antiporter [Natronogracilivirga saccharolytica]MBP3193475.1 calcium/sodium antiporter [Natronogracilivirga saccharolytica]
MFDLFFLIIGIVLLTIGGELLIRGSLSAASFFKVSPLLSGLIIVGFGTSAPEFAVSVDAAINLRADIAIGNVVGSNIGNILLILGLCALIKPLAVRPLALKRDALTVMLSSVLLLVLVGGSSLARFDAIILAIALLGYLLLAYFSQRHTSSPSAELHKAEATEVTGIPGSTLKTIVYILLGLLLLIAGAQVLLLGAIGIAESFEISEAFIGLILVAVGTSLPELSISVLATIRGHADVAVGNILGSNIFNTLGILGVSAMLQPLPVNQRILDFDLWIMLGVSMLLFLFLYTGKKVTRREGCILLFGYLAYVFFSFTLFS